MSNEPTPIISHNALVLIGDGQKALFLRNKGTAQQVKLEVEQILEQDNPATREQGTDRPGRSVSSVGTARSAVEEVDWHHIAKERFAGRDRGSALPSCPRQSFRQARRHRAGEDSRQSAQSISCRGYGQDRGRDFEGTDVASDTADRKADRGLAMYRLGHGACSLTTMGAGPSLCHRARIEQRKRVGEPPVFGPGLAAARHVEHQTEQFPADLLDRRFAGGDAAGIHVDQIVPALPARCGSRP